MHHFEAIKRAGKFDLSSEAKTLGKKVTGKFYTHETIGRSLARSLCAEAGSLKNISVIDPFCGDGRLICWFLEEFASQAGKAAIEVHLWDYEAPAVNIARKNVSDIASKLGLEIDLYTKSGNTFHEATDNLGAYSVCVTNPPWELLKPDRRDLAELDPIERSAYIEMLREEDRFLTAEYPLSQPLRRFSGWGTNLARVGTEVALKLTAENGFCGIVSPASFVADQMSVALREWMLSQFRLRKISHYPAEARLFDNVDQASVSIVLRRSKPARFSAIVETYDRRGELHESARITIRKSQLVAWNYALPVNYGPSGIHLLASLGCLPRLADFESSASEGLWTGREIDETNSKSFLSTHGPCRFIKGRMITRFGISEAPTHSVNGAGPAVPSSADLPRLVWRDVSRPNQKRRMIAALIPGGWVAGNSLHVAYFRDGNEQRLKALLVVLNSFCFEFQVRSLLATSHMSVGVVRRARVPDLNDMKLVFQLALIADSCISGETNAESLSEAVCAQCYGYSLSEFKTVLSYFPKVDDREVETITNARNWSRAIEITKSISVHNDT